MFLLETIYDEHKLHTYIKLDVPVEDHARPVSLELCNVFRLCLTTHLSRPSVAAASAAQAY